MVPISLFFNENNPDFFDSPSLHCSAYQEVDYPRYLQPEDPIALEMEAVFWEEEIFRAFPGAIRTGTSSSTCSGVF